MSRAPKPASPSLFRRASAAGALAVLAALSGCGKFGGAERPAWRAQAEAACFARNQVELSAYIQPLGHEIDGPSICGLTRPLKVTALLGGKVQFNSTQTLDCPMVAELEAWLVDTVQPAASARFGQPVVEIESMGSYGCRGRNNQFGAKLSEHAFGNALDIGGFVLADGRKISIVRDWTRGDAETQAFLRDLHAGACGRFATVLSPGSNAFHYNHIHVDLALHGMTSSGLRRVCKPAPQKTEPPSRKDSLPDAPEIEDDLDIAQGGPPPRAEKAYAMKPGPDMSVAAEVIARAPAAQGRADAAPLALHAPPTHSPLAPPRRGHINAAGVFAPGGAPVDADLPTSTSRPKSSRPKSLRPKTSRARR